MCIELKTLQKVQKYLGHQHSTLMVFMAFEIPYFAETQDQKGREDSFGGGVVIKAIVRMGHSVEQVSIVVRSEIRVGFMVFIFS